MNRMQKALEEERAEEKEIERLTVLAKNTKGAESRAAEVIADSVLRGRFRYCPSLGWLEWVGTHWAGATEDDDTVALRVIDVARRQADRLERDYRVKAAAGKSDRKALITAVAERVPEDQRVNNRGRVLAKVELFAKHATEQEQKKMADLRTALDQADMWLNMLTKSHIAAITGLCSGMDGILTKTAEFDNNPDVINTESGLVDLRTGEITPHHPDQMTTKLAAAYEPRFRDIRWEKALTAIPDPATLRWFKLRVGQAISGHTPEDDVMLLLQGDGENGKTAVTTGLIKAAGTYSAEVSHRMLTLQPGQHPTELMELRGARLAVMEETPEQGRLDTHQLKEIVGVPTIKARLMRKDTVRFTATHTLIINSNHIPLVETTDHGTWRRLKRMYWAIKFLKPGQVPQNANERPGDLTLKGQIQNDPNVWKAALTWAIEGAIEWYSLDRVMPEDPPAIKEATREWRVKSDVGLRFAQDYLTADPLGPKADWYVDRETMQDTFLSYLRAENKPAWSSHLINDRLTASLAAAGFPASATPVKTTKIRAGDRQSWPDYPKGRSEDDRESFTSLKPLKPGDTPRLWRGVRFMTAEERQARADAAAAGEGGSMPLASGE